MSKKIQQLPENVCSKLRSGVTIPSLSQCIHELVVNAIDAGATCLAVRADLSIFRIEVVDNGKGITEEDLQIIGTRHATSKYEEFSNESSTSSFYGFRGEALASIIDMAGVVELETRPIGSMKTYSKLFIKGKPKTVKTISTLRPSVGTTVVIQNIMYNMPVRRKLIKEAIDLENIRSTLETIALIHPSISITFQNNRTKAKILQTHKSNSILSTFSQLFGVDKADGLAETHYLLEPYVIKGYIGTKPHLTKSLQFLYINKRPLKKTKIHSFLNYLFNRSSIISSHRHPLITSPKNTTNNVPSSPPKGLRLFSIFVLNIECPQNQFDITLKPSKTLIEFKDWFRIMLCVEELILKFMREEGLSITLDTRFRYSEKLDQSNDDSPEQPQTSHCNIERLQIFSLKRKGEKTAGKSKHTYGKSLSLHNLSTVQTSLVKRLNKKQTKCDDSEIQNGKSFNPLDNNNDTPNILCNTFNVEDSNSILDDVDNHSREKIVKSCEKKVDEINNDDEKDLLEYKPKTSAQLLETVTSSLENLRRAVTDNSDNSIISEQKINNTNISTSKTADESKYSSSLESFTKFYRKNDKSKNIALISTPVNFITYKSNPSKLIKPLIDPSFTESDSTILEQENELGLKKTLSGTLGTKVKKNKKTMSCLKSLEKFQYSKPSSNNTQKSLLHSQSEKGQSSDELICKDTLDTNLKKCKTKLENDNFKTWVNSINQENSIITSDTENKTNSTKEDHLQSEAQYDRQTYPCQSVQEFINSCNNNKVPCEVPDVGFENANLLNGEVPLITANIPKFLSSSGTSSNQENHMLIDEAMDKHCKNTNVFEGDRSLVNMDTSSGEESLSNNVSSYTSNNNFDHKKSIPFISPETSYNDTGNVPNYNILHLIDASTVSPIKKKIPEISLSNLFEIFSYGIDEKLESNELAHTHILCPSLNIISDKQSKPTSSTKDMSLCHSPETSVNAHHDIHRATTSNPSVTITNNNNSLISTTVPDAPLSKISDLCCDKDNLVSDNTADNSSTSLLKVNTSEPSVLLSTVNKDGITSKDNDILIDKYESNTKDKSSTYQSSDTGNSHLLPDIHNRDTDNNCKDIITFKSNDNSTLLEANTPCFSSALFKNLSPTLHDNDELGNLELTHSTSDIKFGLRTIEDSNQFVYVDPKTGNSSYKPQCSFHDYKWPENRPQGSTTLTIPITDEPSNIHARLEKRKVFHLSHGFSHFLSSKRIKLNKRSTKDSMNNNDHNDLFAKSENSLSSIWQSWQSPNFAMDADLYSGMKQENDGAPNKNLAVTIYNIIHPYKFTREMIEKCQVLGQLDNKFIVCCIHYNDESQKTEILEVENDSKHIKNSTKLTSENITTVNQNLPCTESVDDRSDQSSREGNLIVAFDQHAVHERIRLEEIVKDNQDDNGKIKSAEAAPPLELSLAPSEVRFMEAYPEAFNSIGLKYIEINKSMVSFHGIPQCLIPKDDFERKRQRFQESKNIVQSLITDLCNTLHDTAGIAGPIPHPLMHVFNNVACRGAIKFGDKIDLVECRALISSLSKCQLPFQCAHGRPSIVPLIDLNHLKLPKPKKKPDLSKLKLLGLEDDT